MLNKQVFPQRKILNFTFKKKDKRATQLFQENSLLSENGLAGLKEVSKKWQLSGKNLSELNYEQKNEQEVFLYDH